ncbi:MAG: hypothetical protein AAFR17_01875 [Pseudomonadota bacterium]
MTTPRDPRRDAPGFLQELWQSFVRGLGEALGWIVALFVIGTVAGAGAALWAGAGLQYAFLGGVGLLFAALLLRASVGSFWE